MSSTDSRLSSRQARSLVIGAAVFCLCGCRTSEIAPEPPASGRAVSEEISSLATQFRELRRQTSHFRGGAWNDDVDRYGGRLQNIMIELEKNLGHAPHTQQEIVRLLGEPDSVHTQDDRTRLIYFWRGWHDYLTFVCRGSKVESTEWYYAYE